MIRQTHRHTQTDGSIVIVEVLVCTETEYAAVDQLFEFDDWEVEPVTNQRKVVCTRVAFKDERDTDEAPDSSRFKFDSVN